MVGGFTGLTYDLRSFPGIECEMLVERECTSIPVRKRHLNSVSGDLPRPWPEEDILEEDISRSWVEEDAPRSYVEEDAPPSYVEEDAPRSYVEEDTPPS